MSIFEAVKVCALAKYRVIEQMVSRMVHTHEVAGSTPAYATIFCLDR